jgi:protein-L-isoaspartate(D-aspartate) O-methyltransferase
MRPADALAVAELEWALQRTRMIRQQLSARGITDPRVLAAFRAVPRDEFVPRAYRDRAYDDVPLPIGHDQTISQPYVVALYAEALALQPTDRVLDIGTGCGYAAAIFSRLAREVYGIERVPELVRDACATLERIGYKNVHVEWGDGSLGSPAEAPFDAIAVAASAPRLPQPLLDQLVPGGRLVIPIGPDHTQTLVRVTRMGNMFRKESIGEVRFVPLVGDAAWH